MTEGLKSNSLCQLFVHADDVNTMDSTLQRPIQTYPLGCVATRTGGLQVIQNVNNCKNNYIIYTSYYLIP
jgi:hypothetical protein